jgi:formamidopyrimidine-DNA glycosylase
MPELPDLQVFSRNIEKKIAGKKVKRLLVPVTKKLKVSVEALKKELVGQVVKKVFREGKELHIAFKNGNVLGLHLMLHGDLHFFTEKNENKNTIIEILFNDDTGLALTDWQKMATPTLNPKPRDSPDALSKEVNFSFLKGTLQKTRTNVKNVLMDQDIIRGIGNAYADEILWDAGISPFSVSNKIPDDKIKALAKSIRKILVNAEKKILKAHPGIINGEVRDFLSIHHPKKTQSPTGLTIQTKVVGSRKTYYTEEQKLYK